MIAFQQWPDYGILPCLVNASVQCCLPGAVIFLSQSIITLVSLPDISSPLACTDQ
jgi:hypothetical protein